MLNQLSLFISLLLSSQGFIPHGHCYLWKPSLVWLNIISDGAIAVAYYSIPVLLIYFVSKRRDIPFNGIFLLFGAFIIACGSGHLMNIWTLWHPTYWLSSLLKALTAIISLYTALELVPLIPKVLAFPNPAQLELANQNLEQTLLKLQQTQAQLVQTEKMSSLGQLIAGIAHEINNPVSFIYGNLTHADQYAQEILNLLELYQQNYPQPAAAIQTALQEWDLAFIRQDFPKTLASMKIGADRIRQIVLSLRNFSRLDESEMKPVNIHDGIDSTLLILQHRLKPTGRNSGILVQKNYAEIPLVECYAGELNQVFMNLLSNAIDALEEQRNRINTESEAAAAETLHDFNARIDIHTELIDHNQIAIKISDNGPGILEAVKLQLFNPFFTTKPVGKGTGLGLSISHQIIVEKHRGQLECSSAVAQGTTFLIKLPIHQPVKALKPFNRNASLPTSMQATSDLSICSRC